MVSAVIAAQPISPITPISNSRASHSAVSEPSGATGMAITMARISRPSRVTPRIWVKTENA